MRIQELAAGIHRLICQHELPRLMQQAFDVLPEMKLTPHQMFQSRCAATWKPVSWISWWARWRPI